MQRAYKITTIVDAIQTEQDMSFQGGLPNIPDRFDVPRCSYCGEPLTFFFQVAFPEGHVWNNWVMVFFYCTSWEHNRGGYEEYVDTLYVPEDIHFPDGFLDSYQKNFRIYVFSRNEKTHIQSKFSQLLKFAQFDFEPTDAPQSYDGNAINKVGGLPDWEWGDPTNNDIYKDITYMGGSVDFLMEFERDYMIEPLPNAPLRHEYLHADRYDSNNPHVRNYFIFNGHPLFFFGSNSPQVDPPQVLLYLG